MDTVYVGSWDDYFYAVDLRDGDAAWKYRLSARTPSPRTRASTPATSPPMVASSLPRPGSSRRRVPGPPWSSSGAATRSTHSTRPPGRSTGATSIRAYPGSPIPTRTVPGSSRRPSSRGKVLFGMDVDGRPGLRGYVVAATSIPATPNGSSRPTCGGRQLPLLNDGCGSVWSSGTVLPDLGLVIFGTADCDFRPGTPRRAVSRCTSAPGPCLGVPRARSRTGLRRRLRRHPQRRRDRQGVTTFLGGAARTAPNTPSHPAHGRPAVVDQRRFRRVVREVSSALRPTTAPAYTVRPGLGDFNPTRTAGATPPVRLVESTADTHVAEPDGRLTWARDDRPHPVLAGRTTKASTRSRR